MGEGRGIQLRSVVVSFVDILFSLGFFGEIISGDRS